MALSSVGVSRVSLFRASSSDFRGSNWVFNGYCLPPPTDASRVFLLPTFSFNLIHNSSLFNLPCTNFIVYHVESFWDVLLSILSLVLFLNFNGQSFAETL
ncbi:hypothetical protein Ancab_022301 [Ancistrocladus abbreviatus]